MQNHHKVIIIGSGPAGYTAAIYAARANLHPLMFAGLQVGGQLTTTTEVENYPGFPNGITGPEMMQLFRVQAERFDSIILNENVTKVDFSSRPFVVEAAGQKYTADAVIIATGASAMWLGLDSEEQYKNKGVTACATCDGFFFRGKNVAVVGGGDTAMEEADYLTKMCNSVTVIHRRNELRASKIMQERALKNPKISFLWNTAVEEVLGDGVKMNGLRLKDTQTGAVTEKKFDGLFLAIGHKPNTEIFVDQLQMDSKKYITVTPGRTNTSVEGVFACGDVQDTIYRQAITAAGSGCMAAIDTERWLAEKYS